MNATPLVLWAGLLTLVLGPAPSPQEQKEQQEPKGQEKEKKKSGNLVRRFFDDESERFTKGVEGSWTLTDYTNPTDLAVEGLGEGFATFHDGFLTLVLAMDTVDSTLFGPHERLVLDTGIYRYRFDERASLQLASVMTFTNQTDSGETQRERPGRVVEYLPTLQDDVLQLRDSDGMLMSFRKVTSGQFPDAAIRKLDRQRTHTGAWDDGGR